MTIKDAFDVLPLDGYLQKSSTLTRPYSYTFTRTFEQTDELPEVEIGLGILSFNQWNMLQVRPMPAPLNGEMQYSLTRSIVEEADKLSPLFPNWQERLLLDWGYALKLDYDPHPFSRDAEDNYFLFDAIPREERDSLLLKHGMHKLAVLAAYGFFENLDNVIELIDLSCGDADYGHVLRLARQGIPMEDLHLAVQLPEEMALELYAGPSGKGVSA